MSDLQDDIIKYKKGKLSPKEMHALEKRALSDPFLADALEGAEIISSENLASDVAELQQHILHKKKTILFTPLRIAAAVILVAASVFVFYQLSPKHESIALKTEKQNAPTTTPKTESPKQEEKVEAKKEALLKSVKTEGEKAKARKSEIKIQSEREKDKEEVKTDKVIGDQNEIAENSAPKVSKPVEEGQALAGPEKKAEESKVEAKEQAPVSIAMEPVQPVQHQADDQDLKKASVSPGARAKKYAAKSEVATGAGLTGRTQVNSKPISGKVISAEDGAPLPGVNVLVEGTTQGTVTDVNGNFTLQRSDDSKRLVFSFIGLQTQEVNVEGKDKVDVELKQDVSQLSEVVVTGLSVKRDDDAEPIIHLASPIGGRKAYDKYLDTNVRYPQQALENKIKGKVKVEFSVLTDGSLDDYKVVKSLGHGCDEEVIRLIKEGPKWTPTTENGRPVESTVLVGVKFDPAKAGR